MVDLAGGGVLGGVLEGVLRVGVFLAPGDALPCEALERGLASSLSESIGISLIMRDNSGGSGGAFGLIGLKR